MALVKVVAVDLKTSGYEDAKLKIDKLTLNADELGRLHPEIKPQIDSTKALIEARLLRSGIEKELAGGENAGGGNGNFFQNAIEGGLFGEGGGGSFLTNPATIAGIAAAIAALVPELVGVVSGFAAATAGVGAFGLLALPTFDKIKNAYTGISAAQKAYNTAAALNQEDPTKAHATAAAAALLKLKVAEESMSPATKSAVGGIQDLMKSFDKMALAFAPTVLKVFNDGLKVANSLLPDLKPLAQDAGGAIDGLLKSLGKFTNSTGFKDWLKQFGTLVGPSITAIGTGIGKVAIAFGKLLTTMSAKDDVHAINIFFDTIAGTLRMLAATTRWLMNEWDVSSKNTKRYWRDISGSVVGAWQIIDGSIHDIEGAFEALVHANDTVRSDMQRVFDDIGSFVSRFFTQDIPHWIAEGVAWFKKLPGMIMGAIGNLGNLLFSAGANAIRGLLAGMKSMVGDAISTVAGWGHDIVNALGHPFGIHFSEPSEAVLMVKAGQNIVAGLMAGIGSQVPGLKGQLAGITGTIGGGVNGTPGGGLRGRGNQYTININTLVADKNTGRRVVEAIRAFEQGSGHSWRNN